jgi:hypothetical protein
MERRLSSAIACKRNLPDFVEQRDESRPKLSRYTLLNYKLFFKIKTLINAYKNLNIIVLIITVDIVKNII